MSSLAVLDLDGTLIDTSARHYAVYRGITQQTGLSALTQKEYWLHRRQGLSNLDLLLRQGMLPTNQNLAKQLWLAHIESLEMLKYDQVFPCILAWLETNSFEMDFILVTLRSRKDNLLAQLDWLGLSPFLKRILAVPHQKNPHLAKANAVMTQIDTHDIAAWIGDSEVDMLAANILGVPAVGVNSGIRSAEELSSAGASQTFDSIGQTSLPAIV